MKTKQLTLTQQECHNVKVSLLSLAKQPNTGEQEMIACLSLAQKFNFEETNDEKSETINTEVKAETAETKTE